jgi:hypothetical protein
MLVAGLGALMIDTDNFEKKITSIYVTNGVGSRFFSNFDTNAGLLAVESETRIDGNLAPDEGICNFNYTRFLGGPEYRAENSTDILRDVIV